MPPGNERVNELARNKPKKAEPKAASKPTFHSRVTAGLTLLPSVDGRSTWARIMRDTFDGLISHAGGADYVPLTKRLLARRVAAMESELIFIEDRLAATRAAGGEPSLTDLDLYSRMTGAQRRCLEALGWERTARNITPDPLTYAREYDRRKAEEVVA